MLASEGLSASDASTPTVRYSAHLACVCAALAHFFASASGVHAQETDRQVMFAGGISPISVTHTTMTMENSADRSTTLVHSGLGGQALLAVGLGLGSWVLGLETAFTYSLTSEDRGDPGFDAMETFVTKRTEITLGPSARFLLIEGAVRPYVEAGAGLGVLRVDAETETDDGITLYARGGPGVQLRLADAVSLDLSLRLGYAATSGEIGVALLGRYNAVTGSYGSGTRQTLEYDIQQILADVAARLSIWL